MPWVTLTQEGDVGVIHAEAFGNSGAGKVGDLVQLAAFTTCCQVKTPDPDLCQYRATRG